MALKTSDNQAGFNAVAYRTVTPTPPNAQPESTQNDLEIAAQVAAVPAETKRSISRAVWGYIIAAGAGVVLLATGTVSLINGTFNARPTPPPERPGSGDTNAGVPPIPILPPTEFPLLPTSTNVPPTETERPVIVPPTPTATTTMEATPTTKATGTTPPDPTQGLPTETPEPTITPPPPLPTSTPSPTPTELATATPEVVSGQKDTLTRVEYSFADALELFTQGLPLAPTTNVYVEGSSTEERLHRVLNPENRMIPNIFINAQNSSLYPFIQPQIVLGNVEPNIYSLTDIGEPVPITGNLVLLEPYLVKTSVQNDSGEQVDKYELLIQLQDTTGENYFTKFDDIRHLLTAEDQALFLRYIILNFIPVVGDNGETEWQPAPENHAFDLGNGFNLVIDADGRILYQRTLLTTADE